MANTHELLILTSPPASGKTYWIYEYSKIVGQAKLIIISPLRALRDECRERWGGDLQVVTPEEWLLRKTFAQIVIIDEFHLLFHWGNSFRPVMWEVFYELSLSSSLVIGLTATMSESTLSEVRNLSHFDRIWWLNAGNMQLKFLPHSFLKAPSKVWLMDELLLQKKETGTSLVFCEYRNEVLEVTKVLQQEGFNVIYCLGGEAGKMAKELKQNPHPDMIVSTTVLSHGVNLPAIRKVYFFYEVKDPDFWIQMVARGGRKGEKYEVLALQKPTESFCLWKNFFHVLLRSLRQKMTLRGLFFVSK